MRPISLRSQIVIEDLSDDVAVAGRGALRRPPVSVPRSQMCPAHSTQRLMESLPIDRIAQLYPPFDACIAM